MRQRAKALEPDDVRRLRALVIRHRHPQRDDVIVLLSFKAGLRACEVAGLQWSMVLNSRHQVGAQLRVGGGIAKGGLPRNIPIHVGAGGRPEASAPTPGATTRRAGDRLRARRDI